GTLVLRHLVLHRGERLRERRIVGLLEGHGIPSFPRHGFRLRRRVAPELLQARVAAAVPAIELVAHGILLVVALMVLLGRVERGRRHDLGRNRTAEALGEALLRLLREAALGVVVVEDRGAVLVAVVAELRLRRERVDVVPEDVEQLRVADLAGVVDDLDRLRVAGAARRHLLVGGVLGMAAGVADGGRDDPRQLLEGRLHAPEAPAGEARRGVLLRARGPAERGQHAHEEQARKSAASRLHRPAWMPRAPLRFLRPGHGAQRRDRLLHVPGRLELRVEHVADDPLPVDHEGDAAREEAERRRHAVLPAHGAARVGEQDERQVVPGGELLVRRRGVGADADHLGASVLEVLVLVAEGACFLRAAGRVVLRVEVEDDRLPAAVVAQPHRAAARVREREVGRRVANADAGGAAAEQVEQSHAGPDTIIARPGQPAPCSPRAACVTIRGHARARARAASCRPVSTARVSRPPARALIVPALAAAGFVPLAAWLRFGIDDAFINFRYAANLAAGLGPVFNPGERVEGYTAPAWVLLLPARSAGLRRSRAPKRFSSARAWARRSPRPAAAAPSPASRPASPARSPRSSSSASPTTAPRCRTPSTPRSACRCRTASGTSGSSCATAAGSSRRRSSRSRGRSAGPPRSGWRSSPPTARGWWPSAATCSPSTASSCRSCRCSR